MSVCLSVCLSLYNVCLKILIRDKHVDFHFDICNLHTYIQDFRFDSHVLSRDVRQECAASLMTPLMSVMNRIDCLDEHGEFLKVYPKPPL